MSYEELNQEIKKMSIHLMISDTRLPEIEESVHNTLLGCLEGVNDPIFNDIFWSIKSIEQFGEKEFLHNCAEILDQKEHINFENQPKIKIKQLKEEIFITQDED